MKEKAKEVLLSLKAKNEELSRSIDEYSLEVAKNLEIPLDIAKTLVLSDITNKYEKKLILIGLFGENTLKDCEEELKKHGLI